MKYLIFLALIASTLAGCATQFRPEKATCVEDSPRANLCGRSSFIELRQPSQTAHAKIGFVEFNEAGKPYDSSVVDSVIEKIEVASRTSRKNLLMVVFIHGWHHNAEQTDRNVIEFKQFLLDLQTDETKVLVGRERDVIGIYMGWQAKATDSRIVQLLSYRAKKELGLETGLAGVRDVLARLASLRSSNQNNRLVLIGHSFGGGVLYSAVETKLIAELSDSDLIRQKAYGDLVILMNPAIEAARLVELHKIASSKTFSKCSSLAMASFTSEADTALSEQFPKGMQLFYADQLASSSEPELLTTPYGRYPKFSHYRLSLEENVPVETSLSNESFAKALPTWDKFRQAKAGFQLGPIMLTHTDTNGTESRKFVGFPILNTSVSSGLIQQHNEIWDPKFAYFIRGLVGMEFAKARQCR
jgi:hypothetical protein